MRFAIYCRKSTDTEDRQVLSLESQEKELLDIAKRENLEIIEILSEKKSAKEPGRPVFNKLMKMLIAGHIDALLCWKIDRLTRNPVDGGQIQWLLQTGKIKCIRTFEKSYYPSDNVLLMNIEQAMATQYIRDLSINVKRGNRAKLERGEWPSVAPFGYFNDKGTKTIKVDKKTAGAVVRAFELYATGSYTLKQVETVLYDEGFRTRSGCKIRKCKIYKFFLNKFYCGIMERGGKLYEGKHRPLISLSVFEKAQGILKGKQHPHPKKHFYAARGFLKCASCGCNLTADTQKGYVYYYCTNGKGTCDQHKKYIRSEYVDSLLAGILLDLKFDTSFIELAAKSFKQKHQIADDLIQSSMDRLSNELKLLLERELQLVDGYSAKIVREEVYTMKIRDIENKRVEITQQLKELEVRNKQQTVTFEQVKNIFIDGNKASELFMTAQEVEKRKILQTVLSNLKIENKNIVSYQFKSPYNLLATASKKTDLSGMRALWDSIRKVLLTISDVPVIDINTNQLREAG